MGNTAVMALTCHTACRAHRELIWGAKGLAFLTIVKAGFLFTGRIGTGLVIGRLDDGSWSAPSAICCTGVGWGFQLGGEVSRSDGRGKRYDLSGSINFVEMSLLPKASNISPGRSKWLS